MKPTAYDFKEFYGTPMGAVAARAVTAALARLWPDMAGRRVVVFGYGEPYVASFAGTERLAFLMPPEQGAFPWPDPQKNLVAIAARTAIPIETSSVDGVVLLHSLEFTNAVHPHLTELWRILKSQGRLMIVVPNRIGFWSRVDWSPFGHGTPYSLSQVHRYLRDALFIPEHHIPILYALPLRWRLLLRVAPFLERYAPYVIPALAGLHVVEASKQVYAGLALPVRDHGRVKGEVLVGAVGSKFVKGTALPGSTTGQ